MSHLEIKSIKTFLKELGLWLDKNKKPLFLNHTDWSHLAAELNYLCSSELSEKVFSWFFNYSQFFSYTVDMEELLYNGGMYFQINSAKDLKVIHELRQSFDCLLGKEVSHA